MAKALTIVALAMLALICTQAAAAGPAQRRLQQGFTCDAAKALNDNTCALLCACVAADPAAAARAGECPGACKACSTAAAACPAGAPLPTACSTYASEPAVLSCIASGGQPAGRKLL